MGYFFLGWSRTDVNVLNKYTKKHSLYHEEFILHDTQVDHSRVVYSLFGVLGDVGGVLQAIMMLFASIFTSYSEFSFINSIVSKLFIVNT